MNNSKAKAFKIRGVDHLGIVARDNKQAKWFFEEVLLLSSSHSEEVASQSTAVNMYRVGDVESPPLKLELLSPINDLGPIKKYIDKQGGGIHHFALKVDDIKAVIKHMKDKGVVMIDEEPRVGAEGCKVAFVHPKSAGGILVEVVE